MSDFNKDPYDPLNPTVTPPGVGPGNGAYDKYGNARFEPATESGNGPMILLGLLAAIGIIGGLLYFNHTPKDRNEQTAQAPVTRTVDQAPAAPGAAPMPAPTSTTPAPAADPSAPTTPSAPAATPK